MVEEETGNQGDVLALRFASSGMTEREFSLRLEMLLKPDGSAQVLEAVVQEGSTSPVRRQVALRLGDNELLLGDQLRVQGRDTVFEQACKIAADLTSW